MDAAASTQHDLLKTDLHVKVSRFLEKHGLDVEHLNQLFYKEDDRILPLYEDLKTTRVSESQVRITLLQCLLNAITTGEFQTTVENARVEASTRKCYDKNNWGNNYTNNAGLFDFDKYARTVKTISLSEAGRKALADVIKELQWIMVAKLKALLNDLQALRREIKAEKVSRIAKKHLRDSAERLGARWFTEFAAALPQDLGISSQIVEKYSEGFGRLLALSAPNNLKTSYLQVLDELTKPFRKDLLLPAQKGGNPSSSLAVLHNILRDFENSEDNEYLREAISCAQRGFLRSSIVMGWCATIDRIHRKIEHTGLAQFNITSSKMASQHQGRFKRFNSPQNVNSLGELREVFDSLVLWIIEGMGWIDPNQHTRLRSCFDLRCQCSHPGEAPVTEYNLLAFYSDISQIIFQNPIFKLAQS
jgi:hypothetical protein